MLRHNAELADTFGNLVHRALVLCAKFCGGAVPDVPADDVIDVSRLRDETEAAYKHFALHQATELAVAAVAATNKYVTDMAPWHMAADDPRRRVVARSLLESIYVCACFLQPVLVQACPKVFTMLNAPPRPIRTLSPRLDNLSPGTQTKTGEVLYEKAQTADAKARLEAEAEKKKKAAAAAAAKKAAIAAGTADAQTELSKLEIRVGVVVSAERHGSADALYVEQVDVGEGAHRRVVSGLAKHMSLEELVGRKVVLLVNIKPAKVRGVESQAMLLCAFAPDGERVEVLEPPPACAPGDRITFIGHGHEPERVLNPKKKIFEKLQPELNTSGDCVARWQQTTFDTAHGPCRAATIANGTIK